MTVLLCYPAGMPGTGYTIPSGVTTIVYDAMGSIQSLETVTIPASVTKIGSYAFENCSALKNAVILAKSPETGSSVFYQTSLATVNYGGTQDEFNASGWKKVIPSNVTVNYNYYPDFTIKNGVLTKYIGKGGDVTIPSIVTSIGEGAFYNCETVTKVTIPNSVTSIRNAAFYNCTALTEVTMPDSVTSMGDQAFYNCTSLTETPIPTKITAIGVYTFYYCTSLKSVTIPGNVKSIGRDAFEKCTALNEVAISDGLTTIDYLAFSLCTSLTTLHLPRTVSSIEPCVFLGCTSLYAIDVADGNPNFSSVDGVVFNKNKTSILCYPEGKPGTSYSIPYSVTTIGSGALYYIRKLQSVSIPDSVTSIDSSAFSGCSSLTAVNIPQNVTFVGYSAFWQCGTLKNVNIQAKSPEVEEYVFGECSVETVNYAGTEEEFHASAWDAALRGKYQNIHFNHSGCKITSQPANLTVTNGNSVTFTVAAEGEGLSYQWYVKKTAYDYFVRKNGWTEASKTFTPDPSWNGAQYYCVVTSSDGSTVQSRTGTVTVNMPASSTLKAVLVTEPESVTLGGSFILYGAHSGGSGTVQYKFYYEQNGSWYTVRDYATENTVTLTPKKTGTYTIYLDVKDSTGKVSTVKKSVKVTAVPITATMTAQYASPQKAGTTIRLTVNAKGGTGTLKYKFYSECNGIWTKLWDFDTRTTYNWHATTVGTHTVYCDVRDEKGKVVCCTFQYQIVAGTDFVADLNANRISGQYTGTEIRLLAGSSNGSGSVQYKFYVEKDGVWTRLRDYAAQDFFLWTPAEAGFYNVYVDAKDSTGKIASKRLCITIEEGTPLKVTSLTADPASPTKGNPVTLTGTTTGGEGTVTYKFYYEHNKTWTRIQDFSQSNTCTFTPSEAGTYHVYVDAIDGKKNTQCLMITVQVN